MAINTKQRTNERKEERKERREKANVVGEVPQKLYVRNTPSSFVGGCSTTHQRPPELGGCRAPSELLVSDARTECDCGHWTPATSSLSCRAPETLINYLQGDIFNLHALQGQLSPCQLTTAGSYKVMAQDVVEHALSGVVLPRCVPDARRHTHPHCAPVRRAHLSRGWDVP